MAAPVFFIFLILDAVLVLLSFIQKSRIPKISKASDENFAVMLPEAVAIIGAICALECLAVVIGFTFFSAEQPHWIFYLAFGLFLWTGVYLIIKTLTFKVVVKGKNVTVFSGFKKPYAFAFDEVVSAVRQIKHNQVKSERIVIKTASGKRLIVESLEISYKRFAKKVLSEVDENCLVGFEGVQDF